MTSASHQFELLTELVEEISSEIILPGRESLYQTRKQDGSPVTQIDNLVQSRLVDELPKIINVPVMGEEMPSDLQSKLIELGDFWCVDPIDGTTNYINGIPHFAVSIALLKRGRPVIGMVHAPVTRETFCAEVGGGAYANGIRLLGNSGLKRELSHAVANIDFKRLPRGLRRVLVESPPYASQRNIGSAALEWCYVAAGLFDVYLHGRQKLWDYAAGSLVLEEANGKFRTFDRPDFWAELSLSNSVVAALDESCFEEWTRWLGETLHKTPS